ncbi:hypothetical protein A8F94_23355 [Bacillus sp. FJAT-27225]|uniref:anti-sigma-F factor Fin family protein n=1 Tax=Bacillus sp. FJAT-27225 TaxID=1743144 RepID=UPI00080C2858|nr:anti-sigma-F factor Fin family protein [Bacillus sp. FJAT-27225]OCA80677.1 hypothetical protein A8F94_23355 [Bacillus sp. FJAT-27225]
MAIHYKCRHCGTELGSLDMVTADTIKLGLFALNRQERTQMVSYNEDGDVEIKSICEDCQESFERNPELHQYDYLIH